MAITYPTSLDTTTNLPNTRTTGQTIPASDHNDVASAVIALETKLGATASTPTATGQILTATGSGTSTWQTPAAGTGNATTSTSGAIILAGDLAGVYSAPTVAKVSGIAFSGTPSAGQVAAATSASAAAWSTLSPANTPPRVITGSYSASLTPNCLTTDWYRVVMTGSPTLNVPSGTPFNRQKIFYELVQDATGSRTVTYGTGYTFATGLPAPTLSTAANASDILVFAYNGNTSKWQFFGAITGF